MVFCFKPERLEIVRRNRPDINSGCRVFAVCIGSGCRLDHFRNRLHRRIHLLPLHEPTGLACPQSCLGQMWRYSLRRCPSPHIPVRVDRLLPVDDIFAVPGRGGLRQTRICGIGCRVPVLARRSSGPDVHVSIAGVYNLAEAQNLLSALYRGHTPRKKASDSLKRHLGRRAHDGNRRGPRLVRPAFRSCRRTRLDAAGCGPVMDEKKRRYITES